MSSVIVYKRGCFSTLKKILRNPQVLKGVVKKQSKTASHNPQNRTTQSVNPNIDCGHELMVSVLYLPISCDKYTTLMQDANNRANWVEERKNGRYMGTHCTFCSVFLQT